MGIARSISYAVGCPHCGKTTPKTIAWLIVHNDMACAHCSGLIDLQSGNAAIAIHEFAEQCVRLDATFTKRK